MEFLPLPRAAVEHMRTPELMSRVSVLGVHLKDTKVLTNSHTLQPCAHARQTPAKAPHHTRPSPLSPTINVQLPDVVVICVSCSILYFAQPARNPWFSLPVSLQGSPARKRPSLLPDGPSLKPEVPPGFFTSPYAPAGPPPASLKCVCSATSFLLLRSCIRHCLVPGLCKSPSWSFGSNFAKIQVCSRQPK